MAVVHVACGMVSDKNDNAFIRNFIKLAGKFCVFYYFSHRLVIDIICLIRGVIAIDCFYFS